MDTLVHVTPKSSNAKTGPIPVTTTSRNTCPPSCSWYDKGCYAKYGPLGLHWDKVSKGDRGLGWDDFLGWVKDLPKGTVWRHNQAGDLPGEGEVLDLDKCVDLATYAQPTLGFTYTHKWKDNVDLVRLMNDIGFVVNTSCDTQEDAKVSMDLGLPTTMMLSDEVPLDFPVVRCPAEYMDTNCAKCKLCARKDRKVAVGFTPHGTGKKHIVRTLHNRERDSSKENEE